MKANILSQIDSNEFKDFIFQNSSDVFWILDDELKTILISPSIELLTGFSLEEYMSLSIEQKLTKVSVDKLRKLFSNINGNDKFSNIYIEYIAKDGRIVPAEVSGVIVRNSNGDIKFIYGISVDISEKINLEQELLIEKQKNDEAKKFKSIILGVIGHEFRTPLVGILGFTKMLSNSTKSEDEKEMLNYIYQSAQRLNSSLNSVVTLAALETNQLEIKKNEIDLMELIYNLYQSFEPIAKNKNISFDINIKNNSSKITFDENCLHQILYNLIDNAIKFTDKGRVFVDCRIIEKENSKKFVEFIIQDTGIGIKPSKFNTIFEPFRQISEGTQRFYEGLGLGLTVTKKLVEKLHGTLDVQSKPNEGSIFTVCLPIE